MTTPDKPAILQPIESGIPQEVGTEAGRTAEIVRINPAVAGAKKPRAVAA